jgi:hypothetical protein
VAVSCKTSIFPPRNIELNRREKIDDRRLLALRPGGVDCDRSANSYRERPGDRGMLVSLHA